MVNIKENILDKETYILLRKKVGWKKLSDRQIDLALNNSLFNVCAFIDDLPVGMGRIVGDGAVVCYIQDLVIHPEYQQLGIGSLILKSLIEYVSKIQEKDTQMMLCLMSAKGRDDFYIKNGFIKRPNDNLGSGMIMYLEK